MLRRSAPPSSRCVAKLCRRAWGEQPSTPDPGAPYPQPAPHVARAERPPASCSGTAPAACARAPGSFGARAPVRAALEVARAAPPAPARRRARAASCAPCPPPAAARRRGPRRRLERDELLRPQATGVGQLEHRTVTQLSGPCGGDPSSSRAASRALRTRGRRRRAPGCRDEIGGVLGDVPVLALTREQGSRAASLRAEVLGARPARRDGRRSGARLGRHLPRGAAPGGRPAGELSRSRR